MKLCNFVKTDVSANNVPANNNEKQDSLANELRVMVEFIFGLLTLYYSHGL